MQFPPFLLRSIVSFQTVTWASDFVAITLDSLFFRVSVSYQAPSPITSSECLLPLSIPSISRGIFLLQRPIISHLDYHSPFLSHLSISRLSPLRFIPLKRCLTVLQEILIFHFTRLLKTFSASNWHSHPSEVSPVQLSKRLSPFSSVVREQTLHTP